MASIKNRIWFPNLPSDGVGSDDRFVLGIGYRPTSVTSSTNRIWFPYAPSDGVGADDREMLAVGRYIPSVSAEVKRIWFANAPSVGIGKYDRSQLAIGYPWSAGVPVEVVTREQGYRRARGFREDDEFIMLVAQCFLEITQ